MCKRKHKRRTHKPIICLVGDLMTEHLNYETFSIANDNDRPKVVFDEASSYDDDEFDKKYTILTKKEFIDHVQSRISALNVVDRSLLDNVNILRAIKASKINVPFWVGGYHLNPDVDVSQKHIQEYLFAGAQLVKAINKDYPDMISEKPALRASKNEATRLKNTILSGSPAVALYLMCGNEIDPRYEPDVNAFHKGKDLNNMIRNNMDFEGFSPLGSCAVPNSVEEIGYLSELLECAKTFKEGSHTFFIDENNLPMIMPTLEFYSKYLFGKSSDNIFS